MKCYYHHQKDAVAICKNCNRALCSECAAEVENGIACKGRCEGQVERFNMVMQRNDKSYERVSKTHMSNALLFGLFSVVFIALGILMDHSKDSAGVWFIILGLAFVLSSFFSYSNGKKYKKMAFTGDNASNQDEHESS